MKTVDKEFAAPCFQLAVCTFTLMLIAQSALIVNADDCQITSAENNEIEFNDSTSFFHRSPSTATDSLDTSVLPSEGVPEDAGTV